MACECGATKVYKVDFGAREHSDWCPWSPCHDEWNKKRSPDTRCCNSWSDGGSNWSREFCHKPGTRWVVYSAVNNNKYYFCDSCWDEIVLPNMNVVIDWGFNNG